MKKHIFEVDGIQKRFNERVILSDVYLKCETSDIIGLFGRNGSGKSTLLKIIFGLVSAPGKCIRIDGVSKNNSANLSNQISYLPQEQSVPNHLSVKKVISLSIDKQNRTIFCDDEFIQSVLEKKIGHLSSGELRYLEIKMVLFNPAKFILLDEPYNGLSPVMVEVVNEMIKANSIKKGIIITDHNYQSIIKIATQLVLIKEGKTHVLKEKSELVDKGYLTTSAFL
ncbi:ABC-type lipopolysaccharide export system ATPase subunit [Flavobacterium sp. 90]|uniref:ATP-binding cassette domain-containing protein n=1 Tax=unclassified Flavobacterium TaxID=196869 RepID=UPI000EB4CC45|nr:MULTISPECIES: ATP-binding cassette domain-containing protein [unclassified Flavobacterium]RKR10563.1 ABC-type lipopolysaccharide export system ATPase subunit [Flavobacterium sp. 81]TCK54347.1 ABC-type lipopolysaccharide export system ATPase subunit [Flavobacterium sp. 90]